MEGEFLTRGTGFSTSQFSHIASIRDRGSQGLSSGAGFFPLPLSSLTNPDLTVAGRFNIWFKDAPGDTGLRSISNPAYFSPALSADLDFEASFSVNMVPSLTAIDTSDLLEYIQGKQMELLEKRTTRENACSSLSRGQPVFNVESRSEFWSVMNSSYPQLGIDIKQLDNAGLRYELIVSGAFSSPKSFVPVYYSKTDTKECVAAGKLPS
jgi:hypothetical protein